MKPGSYFHILAALPAVLLAATLARAQDATTPGLPSDLSELSLEELVDLEIDSVFGASRYAQKVTEAPSSVTIVTADEIERYAYRTLADILRSVRGFYVTNDRNYSYLGVRGFSRPGDYNVRVLLLVDGHRLNDNIFGGAYIGTEFPLDVDLIERVEIIRGPSSSLYGTSAFFGVVNVITKRGETLKGVDATAAIGSLDSRKGRVSYGRRFGSGVEMLLSATSYDSEGQRRLFFKEFDDPSTNNGVAKRADSDRLKQIFGKVTFGHFACRGCTARGTKTSPPPRSEPSSTTRVRRPLKRWDSSTCRTSGTWRTGGSSTHAPITTATRTTATMCSTIQSTTRRFWSSTRTWPEATGGARN